ncbi:MAG: SIMPL domain-containing protein, partial [Actinobacteria bacterium]|nr:SIMPL domain-containing protein [Actinomycetota bacterium]
RSRAGGRAGAQGEVQALVHAGRVRGRAGRAGPGRGRGGPRRGARALQRRPPLISRRPPFTPQTVSARCDVAPAGGVSRARQRDPRRKRAQASLYRQALKGAVAEARAGAQALAEAAGVTLGRVPTVVEAGGGPVYALAERSKAAGDATPIEPGTQDVSATVTVTFSIS